MMFLWCLCVCVYVRVALCVCGWVCRRVTRTEYQIILLTLFLCPFLYFQFILLFLNLIFLNPFFRSSCRDSSRMFRSISYRILSFAMNNLCDRALFNPNQEFQPLSYVGQLLSLLRLSLPSGLLLYFLVFFIYFSFSLCFDRVYLQQVTRLLITRWFKYDRD